MRSALREITYERHQPAHVLIGIESQGKRGPGKPASWAYYTSYLWTKYRLPIAPQLPTLTLTPVVAGPDNMPVITDPAEAQADLALAALSATTRRTSRRRSGPRSGPKLWRKSKPRAERRTS